MSEQELGGCQVRYTTKGAPVRVRGDISQEALDTIGEAVAREFAAMCKAASDVPMPPIAQRLHGRETYWCGRTGGHEGPHRWPADSGRVAEWTAAPDQAASDGGKS